MLRAPEEHGSRTLGPQVPVVSGAGLKQAVNKSTLLHACGAQLQDQSNRSRTGNKNEVVLRKNISFYGAINQYTSISVSLGSMNPLSWKLKHLMLLRVRSVISC